MHDIAKQTIWNKLGQWKNYLFIATLIGCSNNLYAEMNFFSTFEMIRNSFRVRHLVVDEQKQVFFLSELSYNSFRKFEEMNMKGFLTKTETGYSLKPDICSLYTAKELSEKWIPLRTFECDHLNYHLSTKENTAYITPSFRGENKEETYTIVKPSKESQTLEKQKTDNSAIYGIVISRFGKKYAWGHHLNKVRKGYLAFYTKNGKPVKIQFTDLYDHTATIANEIPVQEEDTLVIINQTIED